MFEIKFVNESVLVSIDIVKNNDCNPDIDIIHRAFAVPMVALAAML